MTITVSPDGINQRFGLFLHKKCNAHITLTLFQSIKSKKILSYYYLSEISEFLSDV